MVPSHMAPAGLRSDSGAVVQCDGNNNSCVAVSDKDPALLQPLLLASSAAARAMSVYSSG